MAVVYILFSKSINKYYIGSCLNLKQRLLEHSNKVFDRSYTKRASDWELFYSILCDKNKEVIFFKKKPPLYNVVICTS